MINHLNFDIQSRGRISKEFVDRNMLTFAKASSFVKQLPYGRNPDKTDLISVFSDNCGTCSTKHALLKQLADENKFKGVKLMVGLFKMNRNNTPEISATLKRNQLDYIPEAHCYLKYNNFIFDYTKLNSNPKNFIEDLIEEMEISADQITSHKVNYHKDYLVNWLTRNPQIKRTLNDIWKIREQCIHDLANKEATT